MAEPPDRAPFFEPARAERDHEAESLEELAQAALEQAPAPAATGRLRLGSAAAARRRGLAMRQAAGEVERALLGPVGAAGANDSPEEG